MGLTTSSDGVGESMLPTIRLWVHRAVFVSIAWAALANSSLAAVFKCVDIQKNVTFSEMPCPSDSAAKVVTPKLAADGMALSNLKVVTYDVNAPTFNAAITAMRQSGPRGYQGMAVWKVDYKYTMKQMSRYCTVDAVTTILTGNILMPKWVNVATASPADQHRWANLQLSLKHHEDGHIAHGRELSDAVRNAMQSIQEPDCDKVPGLTQQIFERLHKRYYQKDIDYDRETDHGRTQWITNN